ncbi:hypothetical protein FRC08_011495 [Ceratobasidium sp. 394]|nr:hypothetical protein FRC08_011495 [Ceratobasidium sp. 394]
MVRCLAAPPELIRWQCLSISRDETSSPRPAFRSPIGLFLERAPFYGRARQMDGRDCLAQNKVDAKRGGAGGYRVGGLRTAEMCFFVGPEKIIERRGEFFELWVGDRVG